MLPAIFVAALAVNLGGASQPSTITVTVIDAGARFPLANADVIDLATGQHRITDERGQARLPWPADGQLRLRVREVGYKPVQRTLYRDSTSAAAATIEMSKVAYVISPVKTTSHCVTTADSASLALSVAVLEQLKQGAEKYTEFRRRYPFEAAVERRTARIPENGSPRRVDRAQEKFRSESWEVRYKPGDVVEYSWDGSFLAPILFLSTIGDSAFWKHHCFIARGIESHRGARAVRLEFSPVAGLRGPDWAGAAIIDSATSYLLRLEFHLVNLEPHRGLSRLEGYQTFTSPSPYVIMPDSVVAIWWTRRRTDVDPQPERPDYAQSIHVSGLKYRRARPPGYPTLKP